MVRITDLRDLGTYAVTTPLCVTDKIRHSTQDYAKSHLRKLKSQPFVYGASSLHTYQCEWCFDWHVGHKPRPQGDIMPPRWLRWGMRFMAGIFS